MGVQFCCPEAPVTKEPCPFCIEWRENGWLEEGERCDRFCDGTADVHAEPCIDFATDNAVAVLRLMGFQIPPDHPHGECDGATLRRGVMKARHADRRSALREATFIPGGHAGVEITHDGNVTRIQRMGPAYHLSGNTDEQTLRRLDSLERLAVWAQEHNLRITWG